MRSVAAGTLLASLASLASPPPHATAPPYDLATAEAAVSLARQQHPQTRVFRAEADRARAERSAGRALPNPEAHFVYRKNGAEGRWELDLMGDVNGVLLYPWRRSAAGARYRAATHRLDAEAAAHASEVRIAWYRAVAAAQTQAFAAQSAGIWEAAAELARRQREAGTMNALDLAELEAAAAEARVTLRAAEADAFAEREELARMLGLPAAQWTLPAGLPAPTGDDPPLTTVEALASSRNAGLAAAREEAAAGEATHKLAWMEAIPSLKAGISVEQDEAGERAIGPAVSAEIPLFDLGMPRRARTRAERDLGRLRLTAATGDLGPEVRRRHHAMVAARRSREEIASTLLPLRERATAEALKQYNFMLTGVYRLLEARRAELSAHTGAVESLRTYWIERARLESLTGGSLPDTSPGSSPVSTTLQGSTPPDEPHSPPKQHDHHNTQDHESHGHKSQNSGEQK